MQKRKKFGLSDIFVLLIIASIIFGIIFYFFGSSNVQTEITNTDFYEFIDNGYIADVKFSGQKGEGNGEVLIAEGHFTASGVEFMKANKSSATEYITYMQHDDYVAVRAAIETYNLANPDAKTIVKGTDIISTFSLMNVIWVLVLVVSVVMVLLIILRGGGQANDKAFTFGKSRAKLTKKSTNTFADVAGLDEEKEEMVEVVDFLKNPQKYFQMGARIPKGILLVGDPGTGKTLLARAVAGEANVPFYTISGSDFVEMFVGVGASRVRDMFANAKKTAPCIIFIDEIDAVGRQRGTGLGGGHDEREQTLNQLLVEMDGFSGNSGIIVMAATNRVDILDPALLRPGRFDRQIHISKPDYKAREQILKVHARNKHLSPRVNLSDVAKRTPGFSGADLENLMNEAALLAARENCKEIKIYHIDEAIDRVLMGPAKKSKKYSDQEKALVAYHEAGHAVIGIKLKHAQKVQKVTIIPRGEAGGYNLMTPEEETFLETEKSLKAEITGLLAGRIAEQLVFNEMTTGAHNDFQKATYIARAMVTEYGMSSLGPIQYEQNSGYAFLGRDYMNEKNFSDQVALEIDEEVRKIVNECYALGEETLKENRSLLDLIAKHLVEIETLTKEDINELVTTGKLAWYEKKQAKLNEQMAQLDALEEQKANDEKPAEGETQEQQVVQEQEVVQENNEQEEPKENE